MRCENIKRDIGAYFAGAKNQAVRCDGEAEWEVKVNPPRGDDDGKVRLCDICNRYTYLTFNRERIEP